MANKPDKNNDDIEMVVLESSEEEEADDNSVDLNGSEESDSDADLIIHETNVAKKSNGEDKSSKEISENDVNKENGQEKNKEGPEKPKRVIETKSIGSEGSNSSDSELDSEAEDESDFDFEEDLEDDEEAGTSHGYKEGFEDEFGVYCCDREDEEKNETEKEENKKLDQEMASNASEDLNETDSEEDEDEEEEDEDEEMEIEDKEDQESEIEIIEQPKSPQNDSDIIKQVMNEIIEKVSNPSSILTTTNEVPSTSRSKLKSTTTVSSDSDDSDSEASSSGESDSEEEENEDSFNEEDYEVEDAFDEVTHGVANSEQEDHDFIDLIYKTQELCSSPHSSDNCKAYFDIVHEAVMHPSFKRIHRNLSKFDWSENEEKRRDYFEDKYKAIIAFYQLQKQLAKLVHNGMPHLLQMLVLTPNQAHLWQQLAEAACKQNDRFTAKFAYRRLIFLNGNKKDRERFVIMLFALNDYSECLKAIKSLLNVEKDNMVAPILINEISTQCSSLTTVVQKIVYELALAQKDVEINDELRTKVLNNAQEFRSKIQQDCSECQTLATFFENIASHPLTLTDDDLDLPAFTGKLKAVFKQLHDKSSTTLSISYQPPEGYVNTEKDVTVEDAEDHDEPMEESIVSDSESQPTEEESLMEDDNVTVTTAVNVEVEDIEEIVQEVMEDLLNEIEEIIQCEESEIEAESEVEMVEVTSQSSQGSCKKKKRFDYTPRRSTRFVEEIEDVPFSRMPVMESYDLRRCMRLEKDAEIEFSSSSTEYYLLLNPPTPNRQRRSLSQSNRLSLRRFFNDLLDEVDSKPKSNIIFLGLLDRLLTFIATKAMENYIFFNKDERAAFCEIYDLWRRLRSSANRKARTPSRIHALAAEFSHSTAIQALDNVYLTYEPPQMLLQSYPEASNLQIEKFSSTTTPYPALNAFLSTVEHLSEHGPQLISTKINKLKCEHHEQGLNISSELIISSLPKCFKEEFEKIGGNPKANFDLEAIENTIMAFKPISEEIPPTDFDTTDKILKIRYHWSRALQYRFRPRKSKEFTSHDRQREQHHLYAIFKEVDRLDESEKSAVNQIRSYYIPTTAPVSTEFSLETVTRRFIENYRRYIERKMKLSDNDMSQYSEKKVEEFVHIWLHYLDWSKQEHSVRLGFNKKLIGLYVEKGMYGKLFEAFLAGLEGIVKDKIPQAPESFQTFEFFINELSHHLNDILPKHLTQLKLLLFKFTEKFFYRKSFLLWKVLHETMKFEDPKTLEEIITYYNETKWVKERLPLPSLMVLREAHEILGSDHKCMKNEGEFCEYYLSTLSSVAITPLMKEFLSHEDVNTDEISTNIEREIFQLFVCFRQSQITKHKQRYRDHRSNSNKFPALKSILNSLEFILPEELPLFDDSCSIRSEIIDFIKVVLPELEVDITEEITQKFEEFRKNNVSFKPKFIMKDNALEPIDPIHNGQNLLEWPMVEESDKFTDARAKALYLLASSLFRSNSSTPEKVCEAAQKVLIVGKCLGNELLASVWMMIAKHSVTIMALSDSELRRKMLEMMFPFRMSVLLKNDVAEAHLDLGTILYQLHARFKRSKKVACEQKRDFLHMAKTHFLLTDRFKNEAIDISWLCQYFLGKVNEKAEEPMDIVMDNYFKCAERLNDDQYLFVPKVSKKKQDHFEPLELFYRVHAFLQKRFEKATSSNEEVLKVRREIVDYLKYFSIYGVSRKKDEALGNTDFFSSQPVVYHVLEEVVAQVDKTIQAEDNDDIMIIEDTAEIVIEELSVKEKATNELKKLNKEAMALLTQAYNSILSKFPHYKAAYRLAQVLEKQGKYHEAVKILFEHVFKSPRKYVFNQSVFQNLIEIQRSDFERSHSQGFHIGRCLLLLMSLLRKTNDIERLLVIQNSLLNQSFPTTASEIFTAEKHQELFDSCLAHISEVYSKPEESWVDFACQIHGAVLEMAKNLPKSKLTVNDKQKTELVNGYKHTQRIIQPGLDAAPTLPSRPSVPKPKQRVNIPTNITSLPGASQQPSQLSQASSSTGNTLVTMPTQKEMAEAIKQMKGIKNPEQLLAMASHLMSNQGASQQVAAQLKAHLTQVAAQQKNSATAVPTQPQKTSQQQPPSTVTASQPQKTLTPQAPRPSKPAMASPRPETSTAKTQPQVSQTSSSGTSSLTQQPQLNRSELLEALKNVNGKTDPAQIRAIVAQLEALQTQSVATQPKKTVSVSSPKSSTQDPKIQKTVPATQPSKTLSAVTQPPKTLSAVTQSPKPSSTVTQLPKSLTATQPPEARRIASPRPPSSSVKQPTKPIPPGAFARKANSPLLSKQSRPSPSTATPLARPAQPDVSRKRPAPLTPIPARAPPAYLLKKIVEMNPDEFLQMKKYTIEPRPKGVTEEQFEDLKLCVEYVERQEERKRLKLANLTNAESSQPTTTKTAPKNKPNESPSTSSTTVTQQTAPSVNTVITSKVPLPKPSASTAKTTVPSQSMNPTMAELAALVGSQMQGITAQDVQAFNQQIALAQQHILQSMNPGIFGAVSKSNGTGTSGSSKVDMAKSGQQKSNGTSSNNNELPKKNITVPQKTPNVSTVPASSKLSTSTRPVPAKTASTVSQTTNNNNRPNGSSAKDSGPPTLTKQPSTSSKDASSTSKQNTATNQELELIKQFLSTTQNAELTALFNKLTPEQQVQSMKKLLEQQRGSNILADLIKTSEKKKTSEQPTSSSVSAKHKLDEQRQKAQEQAKKPRIEQTLSNRKPSQPSPARTTLVPVSKTSGAGQTSQGNLGQKKNSPVVVDLTDETDSPPQILPSANSSSSASGARPTTTSTASKTTVPARLVSQSTSSAKSSGPPTLFLSTSSVNSKQGPSTSSNGPPVLNKQPSTSSSKSGSSSSSSFSQYMSDPQLQQILQKMSKPQMTQFANLMKSLTPEKQLETIQQLSIQLGLNKVPSKQVDQAAQRKKAQEEAQEKRRLEEEQRRKALQEQMEKRKQEEEQRRKQQEELMERRRLEEEQARERRLAEKQAREAEKRKKIEEEKERKAAEKAAEMEKRRLQMEQERAQRIEEERRRQEERKRQQEFEERLRAEREQMRIAEEQQKIRAEAERKAAEQRQKQAEEDHEATQALLAFDDDQRSTVTEEDEDEEAARLHQERQRMQELERQRTLERRKIIDEQRRKKAAEEEERRKREAKERERQEKERREAERLEMQRREREREEGQRKEREQQKAREESERKERETAEADRLRQIKREQLELQQSQSQQQASTHNQQQYYQQPQQQSAYQNQNQRRESFGNQNQNNQFGYGQQQQTQQQSYQSPQVPKQEPSTSHLDENFLSDFLSEQVERDQQEKRSLEQRKLSHQQSQQNLNQQVPAKTLMNNIVDQTTRNMQQNVTTTNYQQSNFQQRQVQQQQPAFQTRPTLPRQFSSTNYQQVPQPQMNQVQQPSGSLTSQIIQQTNANMMNMTNQQQRGSHQQVQQQSMNQAQWRPQASQQQFQHQHQSSSFQQQQFQQRSHQQMTSQSSMIHNQPMSNSSSGTNETIQRSPQFQRQFSGQMPVSSPQVINHTSPMNSSRRESFSSTMNINSPSFQPQRSQFQASAPNYSMNQSSMNSGSINPSSMNQSSMNSATNMPQMNPNQARNYQQYPNQTNFVQQQNQSQQQSSQPFSDFMRGVNQQPKINNINQYPSQQMPGYSNGSQQYYRQN